MKYEVVVKKILEEAIPGYLENRQKELIKLKEALNNNDFSSIETIGHNLAGCAGGYGFHELGKIGKELEGTAINRDHDSCNDLVNKIEDYINNLDISYE